MASRFIKARNRIIDSFLEKRFLVLVTLFVVLLGGGLLLTMHLYPPLKGNQQALGTHTIALFIPFLCSLVFLTAAFMVTRRIGWKHIAAVLLLYACLATALSSSFGDVITHFPSDDPDRYSNYAHHMVENDTLWGSPVATGKKVKHFVDQPGYRYYLASMLLLFGEETRLMQLFNMFLYLSLLAVVIMVLNRNLSEEWYLALTLLLILSAPYAAKNIVQGLSEWLAISLLFLSTILYFGKLHISTLFVLGLIPFVRQNYILVVPIVALLMVMKTRDWKSLLVFCIVLLIPLWHNLYFAGTAKILVDNKGTLLGLSGDLLADALQLIQVVSWKALTYLGYAGDVDRLTIIVGALFVPYGTLLLLYKLIKTDRPQKILLLIIAATAIWPTILFGSAYYPRFIYSNFLVVFLLFTITSTLLMDHRNGLQR